MLVNSFKFIGALMGEAVDIVKDVAVEVSEVPGAIVDGFNEGFPSEDVKASETAVSTTEPVETPGHDTTTGEIHTPAAPKDGPFQAPQQ